MLDNLKINCVMVKVLRNESMDLNISVNEVETNQMVKVYFIM